MKKICFILIGIILSGHGISCAAEPPAAPITQNENGPKRENRKKPDIDPIETSSATIADDFVIDSNWISVDLGAFEPHAINNSTQIAGDIIADKGGPFAGLWKQGFVEKLDGTIVTWRSSASAINDSGQVAGYQRGRYGVDHERAVLWNNGVTQELGTLGGIESRALAINNSGDIVGWVKTNYGARDAFIWRSGTMVYLGVLNSGIAINNNGQILGIIDGGNPVLWNRGIMQKLEPPGDRELTPLGTQQELKDKTTDTNQDSTMADELKRLKANLNPTSLNDAGQVAGYTNLCGPYSPPLAAFSRLAAVSGTPPLVTRCFGKNAFIWDNGELQYLDTDENGQFIPLGMNRFGMLAGRMDNRAVVWNKGKPIELNTYFKGLRGWNATEARGINDLGQIIVYATNGIPKESKAFLLTPKSNVPILIKGTNYAEVERGNSKPRTTVRRQRDNR